MACSICPGPASGSTISSPTFFVLSHSHCLPLPILLCNILKQVSGRILFPWSHCPTQHHYIKEVFISLNKQLSCRARSQTPGFKVIRTPRPRGSENRIPPHKGQHISHQTTEEVGFKVTTPPRQDPAVVAQQVGYCSCSPLFFVRLASILTRINSSCVL